MFRLLSLFQQAVLTFTYPPAFYHLGQMYEKEYFGKNKIKQALVCYRSAVKYEEKKDHLKGFILGPLDEYQPIAELAKVRIAFLEPVVANQPVTHTRFQRSGFKPGFFNQQKQSKKKTEQEVPASQHHFSYNDQAAHLECVNRSDINPVDLEEQTSNSGNWGSFFGAKKSLIYASAAVLTATVVLLSIKKRI